MLAAINYIAQKKRNKIAALKFSNQFLMITKNEIFSFSYSYFIFFECLIKTIIIPAIRTIDVKTLPSGPKPPPVI